MSYENLSLQVVAGNKTLVCDNQINCVQREVKDSDYKFSITNEKKLSYGNVACYVNNQKLTCKNSQTNSKQPVISDFKNLNTDFFLNPGGIAKCYLLSGNVACATSNTTQKFRLVSK